MEIGICQNSKYYFITINGQQVNDGIIIKFLELDYDKYIIESKKYRLFKRSKTTYFNDIEKLRIFIEWLEMFAILNKLIS